MTASVASGKTRRRRGEAAIKGADPFDYLLQRMINATSHVTKERIAFGLLPYVKPRQVAVKAEVDVNYDIVIRIGGLENGELIEGQATPALKVVGE